MQDIFAKFASKQLHEDFSSYEYRRYTEERGGLSRGNFDITGSNMRVSINDLDAMCFPSDAFLQLAYTIENSTATQVGTEAPLKSGDVAPVNNAWNTFQQIRYKLNNKIISEIRYPGYIKQAKGLIEYSDDYSRGQGKMELWDLDTQVNINSYSFPSIKLHNITQNIITEVTGSADNPHILSSAGQVDGNIIHVYYNGERLQGRNFSTGDIGELILTAVAGTHFTVSIDGNAAVNTNTIQLLYKGSELEGLQGNVGFIGILSMNVTPALILTDTDDTAITSLIAIDQPRYSENVGFYNRRDRARSDPYSSTTDNLISLFVPLRSIFGILRDNPVPMVGFAHQFEFDKAVKENILYSSGVVGQVIIHKLAIWMPIVKPKLQLEDAIYRKLESGEEMKLSWLEGQHYRSVSFDGGNNFAEHTFRISGGRPRHFYAFLQATAKDNTQTRNNMIFDAYNLTSIKLRVNGKQYPEDDYEVVYTLGSTQDYSRVYSAYLNACNMTHSTMCKPAVSYEEFRTLYPMFYFDVSFTDDGVWANVTTLDVTITARFGSAPGEAFYIHLVSETERELRVKGANRRMTLVN